MSTMDVILLEAIDALGKKGEIVKVKNGYARNYLLPSKLAMRVNADSMYRLESMRKKFAVEEVALVKEMQGVRTKLDGLCIELNYKATEEGHLFGSVTAGVLVSELAERGFAVRERGVRLEEPIKSVGTTVVEVFLHSDVSATISVVVDSEDGMLKRAAEEAAAKAAAAKAAAEAAAAEEAAAESTAEDASAES